MATIWKSRDAVRIVIAHSHPVTRMGIEVVLSAETGLEVVSAVGDAVQAVREIRRQRPDVGIIELDLPQIGGLQVITTLARAGIATRVLLFAGRYSGAEVHRAMVTGAFGYLTTYEPIPDIREAVWSAAAGRQTFPGQAVAELQAYLQQQSGAGGAKEGSPADQAQLTDREVQVLGCMAEGISIRETARVLNMSQSTVKNHRHSLFAKLAASNAPAAVSAGTRLGILPVGHSKKIS